MRLRRAFIVLTSTLLSLAMHVECSTGLRAQSGLQAQAGLPTGQSPSRSDRTPDLLEVVGASEAVQKQRIAELIEQLGDQNFRTRRLAELSLLRIGLPAFEQLRQAMNHPNVQIDVAARYLVRSQSVTWWLDTDPLSVRQLLQDYNDQKDSDRETAMQKLANDRSTDALMALCRIARYESSEPLSKCAALYLMETFVDRMTTAETLPLTAHVLEALGDSERSSAEWMRTLVHSLVENEANVESWRSHANGEYVLLQKNPRDTNRTLVTRLHRVIAAYLIKQSLRQDALDIVRPCLDLVENRSLPVRNAAVWAIDAGLPELVGDLLDRHSEIFHSEPILGFLLAESYQAAGRDAEAQASAEAASESIKRPSLEQSLSNITPDDVVAAQRESLAKILETRGMFDWAVIECNKGLKLNLKPLIELRLRHELAKLQSDAEDYADAAQTLNDFLTKIQDNPVEMDRISKSESYEAENDLDYLHGNFNYFSGLAATRRGDSDAARSYLIKALQYLPDNPDVLIALHAAIPPGVSDQAYHQATLGMITQFHSEIAAGERELLSADRMTRQNLQYRIATQCNQLAWLLAKINERPEEALQLSLRSLELVPNDSIFQDTLARCYFANGNIDKAIAMQETAIKGDPHQRSMARQLAEFKAAKQKQ